MTTYSYRLLEKPKESDLRAPGSQGWRVIATGTDPRDGALAWVLMERAEDKTEKPASAKRSGD